MENTRIALEAAALISQKAGQYIGSEQYLPFF
jgi:hypothetical protein